MTVFQSIILGLVQGFTEFLPVSSSGHLVLAQKMFGLTGDLLTFDIFVHFGTLLAVVAVFFRSIVKITAASLNGLKTILFERVPPIRVYRESHDVRMAMAIIIGTLPAVAVGLTLNDQIEHLFSSTLPVLIALGVTGTILLATFLVRHGDHRIGLLRGIIVGLAQAVAIIPGISRSGSTISTALFLRVDRQEAGEFSFLLAIPAISGATVLALKDLGAGLAGVPIPVILLGTIASFISGYFSLVLLMKIIRRGRIGYFGFYCLAISVAGLTWFFLR